MFVSLKTKNAYKYIFYLFNACGFFEQTNSTVRRKKVLDIIFNILIVFYQLTTFVSFVLYSDSKTRKGGMVFASICITYFSFRIYLWINYDEYKKILNQISHMSNIVGNKISVPYWIILWSICKIIIVIFIILQVSLTMSNANYLNEFIFGYSIENVYISFGLFVTFTIIFLLFFYGPLCIFDILYTVVCNDIVGMMNSFRQVLKNSPTRDYNELANMYCEIISVAEYFDCEVGFLIFIMLLNHAFLMYYGFTLVFQDGVEKDMYFYMILFNYLLSCVNFITNVEYASRIHTASLLVKYESRKLYVGSENHCCSYQRFLKNCRVISMTVWGFFNMRRNIIVGTFGTILTYSLLFDNLVKF